MRPALTRADIDHSRTRLTAIATQIYLKEGLAALSLRKLAAAAEMSRSTPYSYFENKQEIVDSIRAAGLDRLTARCARELAAVATDSQAAPLHPMRALGLAAVRFACDEPEIYQLLFGAPVFADDLEPVLAEAVVRFRAISRPPLEEALRLGFVLGDAEALWRTTWAAFHGLISLHLHGHLDAKQLEADFELLNHIVGHGILTQRDPETA